jgi:hypothetical protein
MALNNEELHLIHDFQYKVHQCYSITMVESVKFLIIAHLFYIQKVIILKHELF